MKIDVILDIGEAIEILRKVLSDKTGYEVNAINVTSYNQVVLAVVDDKMTIPIRHNFVVSST